MNNLERLSPADLEALWQFAYRKYTDNESYLKEMFKITRSGAKSEDWFFSLPANAENETLIDQMKVIREAMEKQFHRIIVEGKPIPKPGTLDWDEWQKTNEKRTPKP